VAAHKIALGLAGTAVIVAMAVPFFSMRLGQGDQGNDPSSTTTRKGYDLIATGFGVGYNSTLEAVSDGPGATDPAYLQTVGQTLANTPGVDPASVHPIPLNNTAALVSFKSTASPQDAKTYSLVKHLRASTLPPVYDGTANHIYVYGDTAIQVDFAKVLSAKMPLFIAAVVGLSFLLLMIAFCSVVVPLTAAVMNLFGPARRSASSWRSSSGVGARRRSASARAARSTPPTLKVRLRRRLTRRPFPLDSGGVQRSDGARDAESKEPREPAESRRHGSVA
jgi:putative drug exporter of the RND superfamily